MKDGEEEEDKAVDGKRKKRTRKNEGEECYQ